MPLDWTPLEPAPFPASHALEDHHRDPPPRPALVLGEGGVPALPLLPDPIPLLLRGDPRPDRDRLGQPARFPRRPAASDRACAGPIW